MEKKATYILVARKQKEWQEGSQEGAAGKTPGRSNRQEPGKEVESLSPVSFLQPVPTPRHFFHLPIKLSKLEFVN